jgi:hypothetical protein
VTNIKAHGHLLTAAQDTRVLRYMLLPYGEVGRTSVGAITASTGSVTFPEDVTSLVANMEHDGTRPVAKFISIEETEAGLEASLKVAPTTAGNDLLVEAAEGLRTGISVEINEPVIRKGALVAGTLSGAGFVTSPAFPSALLTAADCGDLDTSASAEELTASEAPAVDAHQEETEVTHVTDSVSAPADLLAAATGAHQNKPEKAGDLSLASFSNLVASHYKSGTEHKLTAALDNVGASGEVFGDISQPQFLGELWDGRSFTQRFAPLVSHAPLTSRKAVGWRWVTKPEVDDYTGFPTEVPSNAVDTEPVEVNAARLAGGWKLNREFVDFNESAFIVSFFRHATDDYARKVDAKVLSNLSVGASANQIEGGSVPSGISVATARIVDGALHLLASDVVPTFAIVGADLYRAMLLTPKDNVLAYLTSALGLEEGSLDGFTIVPSADASMTGRVIVGAREAATLFELPGSPIRATALDVAHAGIDEGVYGYYALLLTGKGLVEVVEAD